MNQLSLRRLARNISLICGSVAMVMAWALARYLGANDAWIAGLATGLVVGILCSLIFLYYVKNFVSNRIRALYKTIYNVKLEEKEQFQLPESEDMILQMQREVTDWMKNRSTEIEDRKNLSITAANFSGMFRTN